MPITQQASVRENVFTVFPMNILTAKVFAAKFEFAQNLKIAWALCLRLDGCPKSRHAGSYIISEFPTASSSFESNISGT